MIGLLKTQSPQKYWHEEFRVALIFKKHELHIQSECRMLMHLFVVETWCHMFRLICCYYCSIVIVEITTTTHSNSSSSLILGRCYVQNFKCIINLILQTNLLYSCFTDEGPEVQGFK